MSYDNLDLAVLKHIISNSKNGIDFINECDSRLFSSEVWNFANVVMGYIRTYKQTPTLKVLVEKLSKGSNDKLIVSVKNVWYEVDKVQIDDAEYKHEVEKLKARFAEKQVLTAKEIFSKFEPGNIDVSKAVSDMQKALQNIKSVDRKTVYDSKDIKDYLPAFVENFNAKKNSPTFDKGLMTKYSFLDYATNGLKPADFLVIAAETGFGKSLLLNNIAIQTWLQDNKIPFDGEIKEFTGGKNIIYFSLEMPYEDCFVRLLSRLSGVKSRRIENADLTKEEFKKVKACLDFINRYPYKFKIVDIIDACANDLEAILIENGDSYDAIFVDYLGIMHPNEKGDEQDWLRQGNITKELRAIARKYRKVMFSAVQLNRKPQGKDTNESFGLNRLARSATIATHCTHVLIVESREKEEAYCDMLIHIAKNRKGPKIKGVLIKDLACATLLNKNETDNTPSNMPDNYFKDQEDISDEVENLELSK